MTKDAKVRVFEVEIVGTETRKKTATMEVHALDEEGIGRAIEELNKGDYIDWEDEGGSTKIDFKVINEF